MIETYQDLPDASNDEVIEFLREQIIVVLKAGKKNYAVVVAAFNTILNEVSSRMVEKK